MISLLFNFAYIFDKYLINIKSFIANKKHLLSWLKLFSNFFIIFLKEYRQIFYNLKFLNDLSLAYKYTNSHYNIP